MSLCCSLMCLEELVTSPPPPLLFVLKMCPHCLEKESVGQVVPRDASVTRLAHNAPGHVVGSPFCDGTPTPFHCKLLYSVEAKYIQPDR